VTIAIPTYNRGGTYLPRALQAACRQSYDNLDILVSDNASTDNTSDVVHAIRDPRVRYHRHATNVGSAKNINFCIEASRGEYTLILNDDDVIDDTFVAVCMDLLTQDHRPGLIRTGTRIIDESGAVIRSHLNQVAGLSFPDFVIAWATGLTTPFLCSTLFRTDSLKQIGMHSRHYLWDDVITELKIAAQHGRGDIMEVHASYCEHGGELTRVAAIEGWCEDSIDLMELVDELAPNESEAVRSYLLPFLADLAYRRAAEMHAPLSTRVRGGWVVYKFFGKTPGSQRWLRQFLASEPWYRSMARIKRRVLHRKGH
jgi:glycosyltransferase involved in cell wall biosynthesis